MKLVSAQKTTLLLPLLLYGNHLEPTPHPRKKKHKTFDTRESSGWKAAMIWWKNDESAQGVFLAAFFRLNKKQ